MGLYISKTFLGIMRRIIVEKKSKLRIILRKVLIIFLLFIVVYTVPRISKQIRSYKNKGKIFNIVRDNVRLLNNSIENGLYKDALNIDGIKDVKFFKTEEGNIYIDYFYNGFGITPSGVYYGFYYHNMDRPIGFQGVDDKLTRKGNS